ncbi:MAG: PQQ-dependent sugar dehydrogenase [Paracoccaceae bacterium]
MRKTILRLLIVVPVALAFGYIMGTGGTEIAKRAAPDLFGGYTDNIEWELEDVPPVIESIFLSLDVDPLRAPVPKDRAGSGGALTSVEGQLLLMTHEGWFFDVSGDAAERLSITPPDNGYAAMLAFEEANPDYSWGHFFFRYNDVGYHEGQLLVSYTEWVAEQECYRTSLATAPYGDTIAADDWTVVFSTAPCLEPKTGGRAIDGHMSGGRFRIGPDGLVYLASGDYAVDGTYAPVAIAQDPDQQYGKVLTIDPTTGNSRVMSQGHSNMQGISFDQNGEVWVVEHGRRGGDELNLIRDGRDYGWPQVSLGTRYNKLPLADTLAYGRHPVFEPPVFAWLPSVAVSALTDITDFHPAWDGDLLAGTLAGQMLIRIRVRDGRVLFAERIEVGQRIRYIQQHEDMIALWTDQRQVLRLRVGAFDASAQFAERHIDTLDLTDAQKSATRLALGQCVECHALGSVGTDSAPALGDVFGRDVATAGFDYSEGLQALGGSWTRDQLLAYLADPDAVAEGTSMPNPEITDDAVRGALVDLLQALKEQPE